MSPCNMFVNMYYDLNSFLIVILIKHYCIFTKIDMTILKYILHTVGSLDFVGIWI